MLPCGAGWRHFNHWRSANFVPVESRSLFFSWVLSPEQGSEDIKLDNGRCRWTICEFSTTVALKKCEEKDQGSKCIQGEETFPSDNPSKNPKETHSRKICYPKRKQRTITYWYCKMAKAQFKRRTLHVPNLMQMRKIYCFRSFALDSAHVKFDV